MESNDILVALRRIMRAIDLHSKRIERRAGLTVPQLLVMKALHGAEPLAVGEIARRIHLSQGTVTAVLDRLAARDLVARTPDTADRRRVSVRLTAQGHARLVDAPPLMQDEFTRQFERLDGWEQKMLTAAVERIAALMDAQEVDASPILQVGEIVPQEEPSP